jgi:membrane-bound lytic murein transglycosylase B
MKKIIIASIVLFFSFKPFAMPITEEVRDFGVKVAERNRISRSAVLDWLSKADKKPDVIKYMDRQAESRPWNEYKPFFINEKKIKKGRKFKKRYPKSFRAVYRRYGLDPYIVLAILGVESDYGTYRLPYRAMDALATLAFHYPRRAEYFKRELEALMVYSYRSKINPYNLRSSYAGAVGMPQFMPSNITKYGADFSGDGRVNIVRSGADSIGSIAKYLNKHGWKKNKPIAVKVRVTGSSWKKYLDKKLSETHSVSFLKKQGVRPTLPVSSRLQASLVSLDGEDGTEYWLLFDNFKVIMRYNPSIKYAMAVTLLSKYIRR